MVNLPNFFIAGAPKCGTTSLAAWLAEHTQVFMCPIKEPAYFASDLHNRQIQSWEVYASLFRGVGEHETAVGEGSTAYLFSRTAIPAIEERIPGARYIVMIRNPIEMAYSLHQQQVYNSSETVADFDLAWHLSAERRNGRHVPRHCPEPLLLDYQEFCKLGEQLERMFARVPEQRVLILALEDVRANPREAYAKTLDFLGLTDDGRVSFPVLNVAKSWRSPWIGRTLRHIGRSVTAAKYEYNLLPRRSLGFVNRLRNLATRREPRAGMSQSLLEELRAFYADDMRKLEAILGRELPGWRQEP